MANTPKPFIPEPAHDKKIETSVGVVFLRKDGILHVEAFPNCEIGLEEAKAFIEAQRVLAGGIKRPLFVNLKHITSIDRPARLYLGGLEAANNVISTALLINSSINRIIGNFMIGMNKTLYPTQLFDSEEKAFEWLNTFLG